ncbi:MAG: GNAT family N-acetyltransferase [Gammaproteobacteria bacterium]|nr:MAG: GNAT family N-acetyltransferase [Gammaproteobacteria bacterium]
MATGPILWHCDRLETLSTPRLYQILQLRAQVFVVEQDCAYLDIDGQDIHAFHLYATDAENELLAYQRLLPPTPQNPNSHIGRVVVAPKARGQNLGKELVERGIAENLRRWPNAPIHIGAQAYLKRFYGELGFVRCGEDYDEDGIPHLPMVYKG